MALTKAEKQILKDFGNDPNYRIDVDARNKIVAIPLHPVEEKPAVQPQNIYSHEQAL